MPAIAAYSTSGSGPSGSFTVHNVSSDSSIVSVDGSVAGHPRAVGVGVGSGEGKPLGAGEGKTVGSGDGGAVGAGVGAGEGGVVGLAETVGAGE